MYVSWVYTAVIKISRKRKMKEEILIFGSQCWLQRPQVR